MQEKKADDCGLQLKRVRAKIRAWESKFEELNRRRPRGADIRRKDSIYKLYREYRALTARAAETEAHNTLIPRAEEVHQADDDAVGAPVIFARALSPSLLGAPSEGAAPFAGMEALARSRSGSRELSLLSTSPTRKRARYSGEKSGSHDHSTRVVPGTASTRPRSTACDEIAPLQHGGASSSAPRRPSSGDYATAGEEPAETMHDVYVHENALHTAGATGGPRGSGGAARPVPSAAARVRSRSHGPTAPSTSDATAIQRATSDEDDVRQGAAREVASRFGRESPPSSPVTAPRNDRCASPVRSPSPVRPLRRSLRAGGLLATKRPGSSLESAITPADSDACGGEGGGDAGAGAAGGARADLAAADDADEPALFREAAARRAATRAKRSAKNVARNAVNDRSGERAAAAGLVSCNFRRLQLGGRVKRGAVSKRFSTTRRLDNSAAYGTARGASAAMAAEAKRSARSTSKTAAESVAHAAALDRAIAASVSDESAAPAPAPADAPSRAPFASRDELAARLRTCLRDVFHLESFRPFQEEIITRVLQGESMLAILPTGSGKSLCYQLPAALLDGLVVVVTPLLALVQDQLAHLPPSIRAGALSSAQTAAEQARVVDALCRGELRVLFVSPERLAMPRTRALLRRAAPVPLVCVDEAHCATEWSHNFRPSFLTMRHVIVDDLRAARVLALTATATASTAAGVCAQLGIPEANAIRASCVRDNIVLTVSRDHNRDAALARMLRPVAARADGDRGAISGLLGRGAVIVYCAFQRQADALASALQGAGISAAAYHAGLPARERERIQTRFMEDKVRVVAATSAFGLGVDKRNVRAVVHYGLPRSVEALVQESGRAGRDGAPARCHVFIDDDEAALLHSLAHGESIGSTGALRVLQRIFPPGAAAAEAAAAPRRYVALPLSEVEELADARLPVIETMLVLLDERRRLASGSAHPGAGGGGVPACVRVLPRVHARAAIEFLAYAPEDAGARSDTLAAALRIGTLRSGRLTADVCAVATALQKQPLLVEEELAELAERSEIAVKWHDAALCVAVDAAAPAPDLAAAAAALAAVHAALERRSAARLADVNRIVLQTAYERADELETLGDENLQSLSHELTRLLDAYLSAELDAPALDTGAAPCAGSAALARPSDLLLMRADAAALVRRAPELDSARAAARVLHGIGSPRFPAWEWRGRADAVWGKHRRVPFALVEDACEKAMLARAGAR